MEILCNRPSVKETWILILSLIVWLIITTLFVGFRPEHGFMALLIAILFFASQETRKLVVALLPFALFGISYDWMRIIPNYEVNPIDIRGLYETEKSLFGIMTTEGLLTPNEFFQIHHCPILDFMAGIFYLCWVPVPILFGLGLYLTRQRKTYLHFALVFLFVNLIGFVGYYIHPAAPPWYVMNYGFEPILNTPGDVSEPIWKECQCIRSHTVSAFCLYGSNVILLLPINMPYMASESFCLYHGRHLVHSRLFRTSLHH